MSRIDEIKARLEAATPGPWYTCERAVEALPGFYPILIAETARGLRGLPDAQLIAHAPDDIAYLLGEIDRSWLLFKSFPHAMLSRNLQRGIKAYENMGGKAGYLASLIALTTVFGAIANTVQDILNGRDPRNLSPTGPHALRNWLSAFTKGGAFGIYSDFLFAQNTQYGRSLLETMAGPVLGDVAALDALTRGNLFEYLQGQPTNAGAEAVQFGRGILPGGNIWYAKLALDHLIFQNLQEYFSPGYLARSKAGQQQKYGTTWWLAPGQRIQQARPPAMQTIVGEKP